MSSYTTEITDRSGYKLKSLTVGGRYYPAIEVHMEDIGEHLQKVKDFEAGSDMVFAVGYPKSGNHWVFEIVTMILTQRVQYADRLLGDAMLEYTDNLEGLKENPRLIFSHLQMEELPRKIPEKKCKIIYMVRNVKDVWVSLFDYCSQLKVNMVYRGTFEDYLELISKGKWPFSLWFDHVLSCDRYIEKHPDVPVYVLVYEKLKQDTVGEIRRLCQFLEKPDHLADAIARKVHFSAMKRDYVKGAHREFHEKASEGNGILRKGVVGDWKNRLTVAQSDMIEAMFKAKLPESPIGNLVKPYLGME